MTKEIVLVRLAIDPQTGAVDHAAPFHPGIFGNPAFARAVFGFVRSRDGTWHVIPNCHLYN